jgi:hypothetical protein
MNYLDAITVACRKHKEACDRRDEIKARFRAAQAPATQIKNEELLPAEVECGRTFAEMCELHRRSQAVA